MFDDSKGHFRYWYWLTIALFDQPMGLCDRASIPLANFQIKNRKVDRLEKLILPARQDSDPTAMVYLALGKGASGICPTDTPYFQLGGQIAI